MSRRGLHARGLKELGLYSRVACSFLPGQRSGRVPSHTQRLTVDERRVLQYNALVGNDQPHEVLASFLAMETLASQVHVMTERSFPFPAVGLVHLACTMHLHKAVALGTQLHLTTVMDAILPHPKGQLAQLTSTMTSDDQALFTVTNVYLRKNSKGDPQAHPPGFWTDQVPTGTKAWSLTGYDIRSYAALSGDINPIHVSRLGARAFGFSAPIAHGMLAAGRLLAFCERGETYQFDATFARPIVPPTTVFLGQVGPVCVVEGSTQRGKVVHVLGRVTDLPARP